MSDEQTPEKPDDDQQLRVVLVRIGSLHLAPYTEEGGYQRKVRRDHLADLKRDWQWSKCEPLEVSRRQGGEHDGKLFVVDGQHRLLVARDLFGEDRVLQARLSHLTEAQEAQKFARQDENKHKVGTRDKFHAKITADDATTLAIRDAVIAGGWRAGSSGKTSISAVNMLEKIYARYGGEIITRALRLMNRAWATDVPQRNNAAVLSGMIHFLLNFPEASETRLVEKLAHKDAVPQQLLIKQHQYPSADIAGKSGLNPGMSQAIMARYNNNAMASRLEWVDRVTADKPQERPRDERGHFLPVVVPDDSTV